VPAWLALAYQRPILVCVCRRSAGDHGYEILLSEPLWPQPARGKRSEILRLTAKLNEVMGDFIRATPEQYFWVHDRWKPES
jgi:KDO2-lipid IV(A) lauroyltransferase